MEALYKVQERSRQKDRKHHPSLHTTPTQPKAMVFNTNTQNANTTTHQSGETLSGVPPKYNDTNADADPTVAINSSTPASSTPITPNLTFEENEYGEMQPTRPDSVRAPIPSGTAFQENQYGEIHHAETDSAVLDKTEPVETVSEIEESREPRSGHFGDDTAEKAKEYRSEDAYAENRFGELGRADTYYGDETHLSDKIKGTAEQFFGKLTGNKELHDRGVLHKDGNTDTSI